MPDDAWDAYKALIDRLVSTVDTRSTLVEQGEKGSLADELQDAALAQRAASAQRLLDELTEGQRLVVDELLSHAVERGAGCILDALDDELEQGRLRLTYRGVALPAVQANETLAGSWFKRRAAETWPDACPVHHEALHGEHVPVRSGRWVGVPEEVRERFPFANAVYDAGCIRTTESMFTVYCDGCRRELLKWCRETGNTNALPPDVAAFERRYS